MALHRTDDREPRERRAHHLPADRRLDTGGELLGVRARALGGRSRARRARPPRAGGALPRARGHDDVPPRAARRSSPTPARPWCVPAGRVHKFTNGGDGVARGRVEVVPALDMEDLLTTTTELALEGNVLRSGMPKPLHLALFVAALPPRGPRPVPARVDGPRPDVPAGRDGPHARAPRALRAARLVAALIRTYGGDERRHPGGAGGGAAGAGAQCRSRQATDDGHSSVLRGSSCTSPPSCARPPPCASRHRLRHQRSSLARQPPNRTARPARTLIRRASRPARRTGSAGRRAAG